MGVSEQEFYDTTKFAIVPMGFCYPGKGKSGDLPPRPECVEAWHSRILAQLTKIKLTILIGQYAQTHYLEDRLGTLTDTVKDWKKYVPNYFPLPHPSPRNNIWMKKNEWFEIEVLPNLKSAIKEVLS